MSKFLISFFLILASFFYFEVNAQELNTYECLYNHWEIEGFLKQFDRGLDNEGIVVQKSQYHALIISFYGIINFHEFEKTGDSIYYHRVVNQYKYFSDSSKLRYFDDGNAVGLPYLFNFGDLKSPWYSGMTQGTAVSYLLRYYKLTKDKSALDLSQKLVRFMLKNEEDGGTIGKSIEGGVWIEEYPNSKSSKSVLNGFINGMIGLHEYVQYFPNDEQAKKIHDLSYSEMFKTLSAYDKPSWTSYNRNGKSVTNGYMRYQLSEFDHLYNIYKDDRFIKQMKIWSYFAINKLCKELTFYKNPKFEYAQLVEKSNENYVFSENDRFINSLVEIESEIDKVGFFKKSKKIKIDNLASVNYLALSFNKSIRLNPENFIIEASSGKEKVDISIKVRDSSIIVESLDGFKNLTVKLPKELSKKSVYVNASIYNKYSYNLPFFGAVQLGTQEYFDFGDEVKVDFNLDATNDATCFYRFAKSVPDLGRQKYDILKSFNPKTETIRIPESGYYQFFISFPITNPEMNLGTLKLIKN